MDEASPVGDLTGLVLTLQAMSINKHFRREGKFIWAMLLFPFALGLLITIVMFCVSWLDVDRCLDAGGKYNYEIGQCVHEEVSTPGT